MDSLLSVFPAFHGAVLFTLSLGAGLSLFSMAAFWVWDRWLEQNRRCFFALLVMWAGCFIAVNAKGIRPLVTLYFALVPAVVWFTLNRWKRRAQNLKRFRAGLYHILPIAFLAVVWMPQMDRHLFVDIRDHILLSSAMGQKINDFYYRYTLYPAYVFKTFDQKIYNTCDLSLLEEGLAGILRKRLAARDFLDIRDERADLQIESAGKNLVFRCRGKTVFNCPIETFLNDPADTLSIVSKSADSNRFFRWATFISLVFGFPILIYLLVYQSMCFILRTLSKRDKVQGIVSGTCFLMGLATLIAFSHHRATEVTEQNFEAVIASDRWQDRVAGLKFAIDRKTDIARFGTYSEMLNSHHIPERYWLARALRFSRSSSATADLAALLNDPQPNVVCMALQSLGARRDRRFVRVILETIEQSKNWYVQWYGYKAMRKLGWVQKNSA